MVVNTHDADKVANDQVAFAAFLGRETASICYSERFPEYGMIALARWLDITLPSSAVVDEAIAYRRRMKA